MLTREEKFIKKALKEAKKAYLLDEVPIGCVIVKDDKIIARSFNTREKDKLVISHCEINAIKKASKKLNDWQLNECELYVTLEPCPMCAGAIYQARIKKVVFGAYDLKQGALGSSFNLYDIETLNHHPEVVSGVLKDECGELITKFFKEKREKKKNKSS
jgi:tRNA(adenine34) deaminase